MFWMLNFALNDPVLFLGTAIIACVHVVQLQAPTDAYVVARWWLQFKDKEQVSF
jgi:hypothetical protein